MARCLYCYKELKEGQVDYHPSCAKKLFGTKTAPVLPYERSQISEESGEGSDHAYRSAGEALA